MDVASEPSTTLRSLLEAVLGGTLAELPRGMDAMSGQEVLLRSGAAVDVDTDPPGILLSAQDVLALSGAIATSHHPGHGLLDLPITVESHGGCDTVIATGMSRRFRLTESGISPLCWIAGCDYPPLYDGAMICWEHLEGLPAAQDADDATRHGRVAYQLTQWAWQRYGTFGREPDLRAHQHLIRRAAQIGLPAQQIAEAIAAGVWPAAARDGATGEHGDRLRATILALTAA